MRESVSFHDCRICQGLHVSSLAGVRLITRRCGVIALEGGKHGSGFPTLKVRPHLLLESARILDFFCAKISLSSDLSNVNPDLSNGHGALNCIDNPWNNSRDWVLQEINVNCMRFQCARNNNAYIRTCSDKRLEMSSRALLDTSSTVLPSHVSLLQVRDREDPSLRPAICSNRSPSDILLNQLVRIIPPSPDPFNTFKIPPTRYLTSGPYEIPTCVPIRAS
jgi:hypothetical protein